MDYREIYDQLAHLFIEVVHSQQDATIDDERCLYYAEPMAIKLFRHLASMRQIAEGLNVQLPSFVFSHVDHGSVNLLARAALETYLTFFFVFVAPSSNALRQLRYKSWELGGLLDRQKFHAISAEGAAIQSSEAVSILHLKQEIEGLPEFRKLTPNQQKHVLQGKWKMDYGWADLARIADFNERYFRNIYSYLCGYAHSSFLSAMQISQARSIDIQKQLANSALGVGVVLMSHFVFSYSRLFSRALDALNANSDAKSMAEKWRLGANDMAELYGG